MASFYTYSKASEISAGMNSRIDAIIPVLEKGGGELAPMLSELAKYWEEEENALVSFVRHSHIENITTSVARLFPLAEYGEYGEVAAELANIRRQLEYIHNSERLTPTNWF